MKILITGATGLVGKELTKELVSKGHIVHYLTTSKDKLEKNSNYVGFYWDINHKIIDLNCIDGVEVIIHLAGASIAKRWTKKHKKEILHSRTDTLDLLFSTLKNNPNNVRHLISASGVAIYPESEDVEYFESTMEFGNDFLAEVVKKWEASADRFSSLGIDVCKLRTGMVLSNKGGVLLEMMKPIKLGLGTFFGNGKQVQPWIHIKDLIAFYCFIMDEKRSGIYNAVAPFFINNELLTRVIARKLKRNIFLPRIPKKVLEIFLGEMTFLLYSSKVVSCQKIVSEGFQFQYPNIEKAMDDLFK